MAVLIGVHLARAARQRGLQAPVSHRTQLRTAGVTPSPFHLQQSQSQPAALPGRLKVLLQAWGCETWRLDSTDGKFCAVFHDLMSV